jgi:acetoin utilization deacetylase AcuC-like enzyme
MEGVFFATYLHPETVATSRPPETIGFVGHSYPYFSRVREALAVRLAGYPSLLLREAPLQSFAAVHSAAYLQQLVAMARGERPTPGPKLSAECVGLQHCLPGYRYALGGMHEALDRMARGELERAYCFSLGGHHAFADWGHGYCLLNPQAAAVRYAQGLEFARVVVVDWDIHHGDGTQAIFANDASVYCVSIHGIVDLYMAKVSSLKAATVEAGAAVGHCNLPIRDERFDTAFLEERLHLRGPFYSGAESIPAFEAALQRLPWVPDLICIFAGYDGHREDCGAAVTEWTDDDFERLTHAVLDTAARAGCPVLSVHGGGYQLPVTVNAAARHVDVLATYCPRLA